MCILMRSYSLYGRETMASYRFFTTLSAFAVLLCSMGTTSATYIINDDPGGQIGPYVEKIARIRASGEKVSINGPCLSACTMMLGLLPRSQLCATESATFGFHAAWRPENGQRIANTEATSFLFSVYPNSVRRWIKKKGGLTSRMIFASGSELGVQPCQ